MELVHTEVEEVWAEAGVWEEARVRVRAGEGWEAIALVLDPQAPVFARTAGKGCRTSLEYHVIL